ncbi:hypothetical protein HYX04_00855 [Candidatus Woesearchaeota archaeon]|nr:hypothetical protein [Candidatus Woesearchaeota archaeon]
MDVKYVLNPEGNALVLKPGKTGRFGGVEYLADHDRIFGSEEQGFGDVGLCVKSLMEDFNRISEKREKLQDFTRAHIEHLSQKSKHVREAIDEVVQMVTLSRYYRATRAIRRKEEYQCKTELLLEAIARKRQ